MPRWYGKPSVTKLPNPYPGVTGSLRRGEESTPGVSSEVFLRMLSVSEVLPEWELSVDTMVTN